MKIHNPNNLKTIDYRTLKEFQGNLKDLTERNAEKLKRVLEKRGFKIPLYLWESPDGLILLDGHQRLRVMQMNQLNDEGNFDVPYILIEADNENDAREQLLEISSQYGTMTQEGYDEFTAEIPEFDGLDVNFDALAFVGKEEEPEVEEDEAPEVDSESISSQLGSVYQLGKHRVMCGDSTDKASVDLLMGGNKAEMVFTDPPYGVEYTGGQFYSGKPVKDRREQIKNDANLIYDISIATILDYIDDGAFYICYASSYSIEVLTQLRDIGLEQRAILIWNKTNTGYGDLNSNYKNNYEPIFYGLKKGNKTNFSGDTKQTTVWSIDKPKVNMEHPTMKPIELCVKAIVNSSNLGDTVIDIFLGSGSTLIACEQTDRTCYGMELDPKYVDVIRKRYAKFVSPEDELPENWEELTPVVEKTGKVQGKE